MIATARGSGGGRTLLLNAHMDTVGVDTMEAPFDARVEDGRLYGRGSYDMKGSLAAILVVAAEAKRLGLRGDVVVAAVADEEVASVGTESLVASGRRFDAAVVAEPNRARRRDRAQGLRRLRDRDAGGRAHGSRPDLGEDAIVRMAPVLTRLDELASRLLASPTHQLLGSGSVHASLIVGGQEFSSYPERCLLTGERRRFRTSRSKTSSASWWRSQGTRRTGSASRARPFEVAEEEEIVRLVQVTRAPT